MFRSAREEGGRSTEAEREEGREASKFTKIFRERLAANKDSKSVRQCHEDLQLKSRDQVDSHVAHLMALLIEEALHSN